MSKKTGNPNGKCKKMMDRLHITASKQMKAIHTNPEIDAMPVEYLLIPKKAEMNGINYKHVHQLMQDSLAAGSEAYSKLGIGSVMPIKGFSYVGEPVGFHHAFADIVPEKPPGINHN
jgi:hypothetical protein